jgi:hypothetical protein
MSGITIFYCPHHNEYYVTKGTNWPDFELFKCLRCRRQNETYTEYIERIQELERPEYEIDRGMPLNPILKQAFNEWRKARNYQKL